MSAQPPSTPARERLQRALHDPAAWIADPDAARAAWVLREPLLRRIDAALGAAGLRALLVKGAGLAFTAYPKPWLRPMCDVDLLVEPAAEAAAAAALQEAGFEVTAAPAGRAASRPLLAERQAWATTGVFRSLVEVQPHLDKIVARPIDNREILERGLAVEGLAALRAPSHEDHALLVMQHLATCEFHHPLAWVDLGVLVRGGLRWADVEGRARAWKLRTAAWLALRTLRDLGLEAVPAEVVARLRPGPLRRSLLRRYARLSEQPVRAGIQRFGVPWMLGQAPLRDDSVRWLLGVARYAGVRLREEVGRRLRRRA